MNANSNYPMGVSGSSRYFNQPDEPECPQCGAELEHYEWSYCPFCGERIDWKTLNGEEWWTCS